MAILFNNFSMTLLLVVVGIAHQPGNAAYIGIVQAASLATFYVFSANARNLILSEHNEINARKILYIRLRLVIPLSIIASVLSLYIGNVPVLLGGVLVVRKVLEWFAEVAIAYLERESNLIIVQQGMAIEILTLLVAFVLILHWGIDLIYAILPWALAPIYTFIHCGGVYKKIKLDYKPDYKVFFPHIGSTLVIGLSVYAFRFLIVKLAGPANAGELYTAFAVGGVIPTVFGQAIAPTLVHKRGKLLVKTVWFKVIVISMLVVFLAGGLILQESVRNEIIFGHDGAFWMAVGLSVMGGAVMTFALILRAYIINTYNKNVFASDLISNSLIILAVPLIYYSLGAEFMGSLYLMSSLVNILCILLIYKYFVKKNYSN